MRRLLLIPTCVVLASGTGVAHLVVPSAPQAAATLPVATRVATMPEPAASFGAIAANGWLYVYGGHVSPTHAYSTAAVSGRFNRLRLAGGGMWEPLPPGPPAQGLSLAAHHGLVYRVGGMQPQNRPGDPEDTRSLADSARFNPAIRQWETLPSLPAPRSSHDLVVSGDRLFVIGGWNLQGKTGKTEWPSTMEVLDLAATTLGWTSLPQPFRRRAFTAVANGSMIYVLGGFDDRNRVVKSVDVYDAAANSWTAGPALPGGAMSGFGPAAAVFHGRVVISIDDGALYRLSVNGSAWEPVGRATPRIVHRLVAEGGDRVLILGGARGGANLDLVEALALQP
jgi:N-acetylneuraminic acid mutarotase